jgi:two-component system, NtrC family, response regulator AtoC
LTWEATAAEDSPMSENPLKSLVGQSEAMCSTHDLIRRAARTDATVLIRGESGTGKELAARALHEGSARRQGPFVAIHCAALPDTLLESELFGHEKGAFTGAAVRTRGRIEMAEGGTLFLDEVGDIPPSMQVKLLRVIQEREIQRLGGRDTIGIDVRFVAATHRDLETMVARGEFREDLFYRLNVLPLWLPPLRERTEDVPLLVDQFCAPFRFDRDAVELLSRQPWPGNVRQLQNFVARLLALGDGPRISVNAVRRELNRERMGNLEPPTAAVEDLNLEVCRLKMERRALGTALAMAKNNRTVAARILGVSRRTLYTKLEQHGLL